MSDGPASKRKGEVVEGFRILDEVGRGAASVIYLVQDQKTKQVWALKHVEKNNAKDQRFLDQAEIEYRIAGALEHETIRKIPKMMKKGSLLKVKELYLVMEYLDGVSMERHPPKTFDAAMGVFIQVARGLAHMHDRGIVHADMKPNNIVLMADERAKIIDLGQSCRAGTIKPRIQGTPDYIAPEQVHRKEITGRTDVYNFGATMYWVLTRRHIPTALAKGDRLVGSVDDTLLEKPTPPAEINSRVPQKLDELIMHCVEPKVESRPESMDKVADTLELILGQMRARSGGGGVRPSDDSELIGGGG